MNRLAPRVLELLEREPLRPAIDELAEALNAPAEEVLAALEELHDLAQAAEPPPQGGKILNDARAQTIRAAARATPRNCAPRPRAYAQRVRKEEKFVARPKKPAIGSRKWAEKELEIAEIRLRQIRKQIAAAGEAELPSLLRLEMAARREVERLARAAAPQVVTDFYYGGADLEGLERAVLGEDGDDD